jgi:hypothetical protein
MRARVIVAAKIAACFPAAWFGGNVLFGLLATGSWILIPIVVFFPDWVSDVLITGSLWLCRLVVFVMVLVGWVFEAQWEAAGERRWKK